MHHIAHIITGLSTGGAETMLHKLLSGIDPDLFHNTVISLTNRGQFAVKLEELGVSVYTCDMAPGRFSFYGFYRLIHLLRRLKPDIVQTWLYHADLLGGLAATLSSVRVVVWNVRNSILSSKIKKRHTLWTARINGLLSGFITNGILCNSSKAILIHQNQGFRADKFVIIPNGFNVQQFHPDKGAYKSVRKELGIGSETSLVGLVARFDPQKNHRGFIEAAAIVAQKRSDVRFLLIGNNMDGTNDELCHWINTNGLSKKFHLLGRRDDIPRLNAAFDIAVCCSWGEGFPNSIGEAMACGVPCVVTDVGDCAKIVGDTGRVVNIGDMANLAHEINDLLDMPIKKRLIMGEKARQRIQKKYRIETIVRQYEAFYFSLMEKSKKCAA
jgi:glycosyltransferase involved in cell wall biosynthesis